MAEIRMNRAAIAALLKSPEIRRELRRRAQKIADAAGDGFEVRESEPRVRARVAVVATTMRAKRGEAKDGRLSHAIGAGRG